MNENAPEIVKSAHVLTENDKSEQVLSSFYSPP